jgi:hypothetical protein
MRRYSISPSSSLAPWFETPRNCAAPHHEGLIDLEGLFDLIQRSIAKRCVSKDEARVFARVAGPGLRGTASGVRSVAKQKGKNGWIGSRRK